MTSQFVAMNKQAVVLATDSAASIICGARTRTFFGARKLFPIGQDQRAAILVHGNAELNGAPWSTLVGDFAAAIAGQRFDTIEALADRLIAFLEGSTLHWNDRQLAGALSGEIRQIVHVEAGALWSRLKREGAASGGTTEATLVEVFRRTFWERFVERPIEASARHCRFVDGRLSEPARAAVSAALAELALAFAQEDSTNELLVDIALTAFQSRPDAERARIEEALIQRLTSACGAPQSGVVVAGFGDAQAFPQLVRINCYGFLDHRLRFNAQTVSIDADRPAAAVPFAQSEATEAILYGANPQISQETMAAFVGATDDLVERLVGQLVSDGIIPTQALERVAAVYRGVATDRIPSFQNALLSIQQRQFDGMTSMIQFMGERELSELAFHMIGINSMHARLSNPTESVGGAVSVAVISRSCGCRVRDLGALTDALAV